VSKWFGVLLALMASLAILASGIVIFVAIHFLAKVW
jgi:hypothetical protein